MTCYYHFKCQETTNFWLAQCYTREHGFQSFLGSSLGSSSGYRTINISNFRVTLNIRHLKSFCNYLSTFLFINWFLDDVSFKTRTCYQQRHGRGFSKMITGALHCCTVGVTNHIVLSVFCLSVWTTCWEGWTQLGITWSTSYCTLLSRVCSLIFVLVSSTRKMIQSWLCLVASSLQCIPFIQVRKIESTKLRWLCLRLAAWV